MPRDGSGIYQQPAPDVVEGTTIESAVYNLFTRDVEQDLNDKRPIIAGGTGANNPDEALFNLKAEKATQVVTNFDSHIWYPGSWRSAVGATGAPVADHAFAGVAYLGEPLAYPLANQEVIVEARDLDDASIPGTVYVREKKAGVWEPTGWKLQGAGNFVVKAGDTMTGDLTIDKLSPSFAFNMNGALQSAAIWSLVLGLRRWQLALGDGSAGGDFSVSRYDDAGVFGGSPLTINRASGLMTLSGNPTDALGAATKQYVDGVAIPAGTKMVFFQSAAPTGWTKDTSNHDAGMRVVNGATGGSATGAQDFSVVFGRTQVDNTTLIAATVPNIQVGFNTAGKAGALGSAIAGAAPWGLDGSYAGQARYDSSTGGGLGAQGGGSPHSHTIDLRIKYLDVIICIKN